MNYQTCSLTHWRHFSCPIYNSAVRKPWPLYLNDAVSILQLQQGGQSSGIIVMRPTGCPEEEVSTELYSSIQGQGGALQGDSHHCISFLLVSKRVSLEHGVVSPAQNFMTCLSFFIRWEFTVTQPWLTWIEFVLMKRKCKKTWTKSRNWNYLELLLFSKWLDHIFEVFCSWLLDNSTR